MIERGYSTHIGYQDIENGNATFTSVMLKSAVDRLCWRSGAINVPRTARVVATEDVIRRYLVYSIEFNPSAWTGRP